MALNKQFLNRSALHFKHRVSHWAAPPDFPNPQSSALSLFLSLLFTFTAYAQYSVKVPSEIQFANQRLELSKEARKKIQTNVDALTRNEKYFQAKVDRINAYFPLIEAVLREERVPEDIKYLVIQESALVGDAVSSSNAIGYWQFKQASAEEVGLLINGAVDERMNIVTATRGAARYFKSNNARFDNWLYALLAYYEGPGGALKKTDQSQYGARKMRLKGNTHWYVLKYLSHKVAFESAVGKDPSPPVQLTAHTDQGGKTLIDVARDFDLQVSELEPYNRWLKQRRIPQNKLYPVIVPHFDTPVAEPPIASQKEPRPLPESALTQTAALPSSVPNPTQFAERSDTDEFPIIREVTRRGEPHVLINGIPGIIARDGEDVGALARRADIAPSKLIRYNDLKSKYARIEGGRAYYLRSKRNRALAHYHTVGPDEDLWSVSQRLGIKLKKLMRDNRMREEKNIRPGRVLWARLIRPESVAITYQEIPSATTDAPTLATQETYTEYPTEDSSAEDPYIATINKAPVDDLSATSPSSDTPTSSSAVAVLDDPKGLSTANEDAVWRASDIPGHHTVEAGETLFSIARQYQLSPKQLAEYNDLKFGDPLAVGQSLWLSASENAAPERPPVSSETSPEHEVQPGETMFQIARRYGITIKELMEWNDKEDFNLSVGERLTVAR